MQKCGFFPALAGYSLLTVHNRQCQAKVGYKVGSYLNQNKKLKKEKKKERRIDKE